MRARERERREGERHMESMIKCCIGGEHKTNDLVHPRLLI